MKAVITVVFTVEGDSTVIMKERALRRQLEQWREKYELYNTDFDIVDLDEIDD